MRSKFVLIIFGSLLVQILARPQQATEYNNESDAEEAAEDEEENENVAEELMTDDEDSRLADQDPAVQEEEIPQSRHMLDLTESRYLQRNSADDRLTRTKTEDLSDLKTSNHRDARQDNPEASHFNDQLQSFPRLRKPNRYTESNDEQQEATEHLINRNVYKGNRLMQGQGENQINKRTVQFEGQSNEEGDMLFEKNGDQVSKVNRNENNNNEASDTNEQSRYFKQYYNTLQAENRVINEEKGHDGVARYNLRDRRDVKEANPADAPTVSNGQENKESNDKPDGEDEESAIKRHIKKLSGDELNQLLNSLTDDRRELLKKIIDDSVDNAFINKREITKKAGAVEENNLIENCQSDLSKVQGGSPVVELNTEAAPSPNTEPTDMNKQPEAATEVSDISSQKSSGTSVSYSNKLELTNNNDESLLKPTDGLNALALNLDTKNEGKVSANPQVSSKIEIKREANLDDMDVSADDSKTIDDMGLQNGQDYGNDQGYFSSQDESSSKLLNDDGQFHEDGKEYKREADPEKQSDFTDAMKSLEDSFPNSNAYDDSMTYSGPLVRVKRKNINEVIKKRSAGLFPDAKVGYFPYKAENEDEDNDEGNEFDDEGFYDRNTNFANSNKGLEEEPASAEQSTQAKNSNVDNSKAAPHENLENEDSMSLGSDTDGVLSGVEGVDDNLMYNSDARNRRGTEDDSSKDTEKAESERSTLLLENEKKSAGDNFFNAPHYQENDAYGPVPRNYEGDLNRYKRIRRVKQSHNEEEPTASDG